MGDTFDHKSNIDELIRGACDFQADLIRARAKTQEIYRSKEPVKHNSFRITLDGLIVRTSQVLSNRIENTNEKISYQISLVISFVRTHFIINDMIMEGDLIEAFTLIRKNFESLTRLHEIDSNPLLKLLKKTPNVINLFKEGGKKLYPTLSEIAHFGTPAVGDLLTITSNEDGRVGPSIVPVYNPDAIACYDRHAYVSIYFVFWLVQFLKNVYGEQYDSKKDERTLLSMLRMAEESGIIELKPEEGGKKNHAASS
ncbi:hypothetical protein [Flavisolibacter ginsenosidimutans]|uniref:Uncharacterized protein n=1 Tax=Flavisolibacter ginsenosidimutans TaxID=661481 RepID=A0A5B8UJ71_9BACT|nr:hypothetical protein [Flavisolibacter ginsenosidimutans]QEC56593.1 hypothetical protein FSB75_12045 [Flavisolibacter ginsenosidimutans]